MSDSEQSSENTYVIDAENPAETARLVEQDRLVTKSMGSLFPAGIDASVLKNVVDVGCGPGRWVCDVAFENPEAEVVGIDISEAMIRYALSLARSQRLDNVRFQVMDATKPLDFSADFFDFVNARYVYCFMPKAAWPSFLRECLRVTRPGGFAHLAESELSITNSLACERLGELIKRAMFLAGFSFSPDGKNLGITTGLSRLLREAGYQNIQKSVSVLDFSAGQEANNAYSKNLLIAYELIQPFLIKMGVAVQEELDELLWQMQQDVLHDGFDGLIYILRAWGQKPA